MHFGPCVGREAVTGLAQRPLHELQQPCLLAVEVAGLVGCGEPGYGLGQIGAERTVDEPVFEPFLGLVARVTHRLIGVGRTP